MTDGINLVYNAAVADERLKKGTKYERLTAIVFKILQQSAYVVHDVRLRGDGKRTRHQIDVQICRDPQDRCHRVLVECKEIRDFNGALMQLQPARGIFVTTTDYTVSARTYAWDENIALVELRPFSEQDWHDRVREIVIEAKRYILGTPFTDWSPTGRGVDCPPGVAATPAGVHIASTSYYDKAGNIQGTLAALLDGWRREVLVRGVPMDGTAEILGTYALPHPVWLPTRGVLAEFTALDWKIPVEKTISQIKVHQGERIADLILRSVQLPADAHLSDAIAAGLASAPETIVFRDQIGLWTVDAGGVIRLRFPAGTTTG